MPAYSFSAIKSFQTCPKKHWHTRIRKDVLEEEGEALLEGKRIHKAIERRVMNNILLPPDLRHMDGICQRFMDAPGTKQAEVKLAVNRDFQPVAFFDKTVFFRAVIDLVITNKTNAVVVDWKTGNRIDDDFTQLKIGTAMLMQSMPEIESAVLAFIYTAAGQILPSSLDRSELSTVWADVIPLIERMERSEKTTDYPATPNGLCRRYCPVSSCPHHGG
jgi:CRISPR/Cas system-associated exonuclease Cas4 (RecB family)